MNLPHSQNALARDASAHLQTIIDIVRKPAGFAALNIEQRKFLLAALLASIVPADGKVRDCEMETLEAHLHAKLQARGQMLAEALAVARQNLAQADSMREAARHLPELLGIEDRCNLIGMLWDIALCDHELHASEERLIYQLADFADVPRKKVAEQQARASSRNG